MNDEYAVFGKQHILEYTRIYMMIGETQEAVFELSVYMLRPCDAHIKRLAAPRPSLVIDCYDAMPRLNIWPIKSSGAFSR